MSKKVKKTLLEELLGSDITERLEKGEFLTKGELKELTGFSHPGKQITQLRLSGIPFFTNGRGRPVVARSLVNGMSEQREVKRRDTWVPPVLR